MLVKMVAIACVLGLAVGQILFKSCATSLSETGSFFALKTAGMILLAMMLYATTSIAWVWVLQKVELGKVYPFMALAFILVPLGSYFVFGERFQIQYGLGVTLIVFGILIATNA